ncbi:MAG: hypothetical protein K5769_07890 [Pseudobutyrivibrio sp.]|nr:hypothetical protein [Pseudobutyrivibrio sp.]
MSKRSVENLLKGVVITGTAVGGASLMGDAKIAYAEALELDVAEIVTPPVAVETNAPAAVEAPAVVETPVAEAPTVVETPVVEAPAVVETPVVEAPVVEAPVAEQPAVEAPNLLFANAAPAAQTNEVPIEAPAAAESQSSEAPVAPTTSMTDEEEYAAFLESVSEEDILLASTSEYNSTSQYQASESMAAALASAETQYTAASETYHNSGYDTEGLAEQEEIVKSYQDAERIAREAAAEQQVALTSSNYYNKNVARGLAQEMIKYRLLQEGLVNSANLKNIKMEWVGSQYESKYLLVQYLDNNLVYHEEYYDYVTCDAEGNSLYRWEMPQEILNGVKVSGEDNPLNVAGINVVKKNYEFTDQILLKDAGTAREREFQYILKHTDDAGKTTEYKGSRYVVNMIAVDGHYKGGNYYTTEAYTTDVTLRSELPSTISSLASTIASIQSQQVDFIQSVLDSIAFSQSANTLRSESLSTRAVESAAASTSKSESIIASQHESLSTSASEAASLAAASSESYETSEVYYGYEADDSYESITSVLTASTSQTAEVAATTTQATAASSSPTKVAIDKADEVAPAVEVAAPVQEDVAFAPISENPIPLAVVDVEETEAPTILANSVVDAEKTATISDEDTARIGGSPMEIAKREAIVVSGGLLAAVAATFKVHLDVKRIRRNK